MGKRSIISHFRFNKQERNGIFFLLLIIVSIQLFFYLIRIYSPPSATPALKEDAELQLQIDRLREEYPSRDSLKIYPFNPNYITDYKGYTLGMSPQEIDRLHIYRSDNKFVNSPEEFQEVTLVSDSLLAILALHFKFPDWTQRSDPALASGNKVHLGTIKESDKEAPHGADAIIYRDLNLATAGDFMEIYGVGDVLSQRIVKFRDRLGGFLVEEQLNHVYGLEKEVVDRILKRFRIHGPPEIIKIDINEAPATEIAKLVYIDYEVALRIVAYREANGLLGSFDRLMDIEDFPSEKIDIIQLYLQL